MTRTSNENLSANDDEERKTTKNPLRYRKGRITRNPFLNFLREIRKNTQGLTVTDIAVKGAGLWRKMDAKEKKIYQDQAKSASPRPRKKRRKRRSFRSHSRSRSYSRSPSRNRRVYHSRNTTRY